MILLKLFYTFFKIGLFTFGGGYAMISLLKDICIQNNWISQSDLLNLIAVSESTPGPIAINASTYIGSKVAGILGSLLSTLGVIIPSFIIILLIAKNMDKFKKNKTINSMLLGIKPCIVALILSTAITMLFKLIFNFENIYSSFNINNNSLIILIIILTIHFISKKINKKISPIIMILISAFIGIIINIL